MSDFEYDVDLYLQERGVNSPDSAEFIVSACFARLQRLARLATLDAEAATQAVIEVIDKVVADLPNYYPGANFRIWLYQHFVEYFPGEDRPEKASPALTEIKMSDAQVIKSTLARQAVIADSEQVRQIQLLLRRISFTERLLLAFRFAEGLDLPLCAQILDINVQTAHAYFDQIRWRLSEILFPAPAPPNAEAPHTSFRQKINAGIDGLLDESEAHTLHAHLLECEACRDYQLNQQKLHAFISSAIPLLWPVIEPSGEEIRLAIQETLRARTQRDRWNRIDNALREGVWLVIPVVLAILFILNADRLLPAAEVNPTGKPTASSAFPLPAVSVPSATPEPEPLPPVPRFASQAIRQGSKPGTYPIQSGPQISEDGNWVVFASSGNLLVPEDTNSHADIFLFDRLSEEISRLSNGAGGDQADGHSFSPSISADGRYIVFSSLATNLISGAPQTCENMEQPYLCTRVYLVDRVSGEATLLSRPTADFDPLPAIYPYIAGDGSWIFYWAPSKNNVQISENCQPDPNNLPDERCWDIIIYDRQRGTSSRLEVGKRAQPGDIYSFALDSSFDGQRLIFTISSRDLIAQSLIAAYGALPENHVFAYDHLSGHLQPVDLDLNGKLPQEPSFMGRVSHDGRLVAFVSAADGLVKGDQNRWFDLFLHDLDTGNTERISLADQGEELFQDNTFLNQLGDWLMSYDISADGSQVVFLSNAPELNPDNPQWCDTFSTGPVLCYHLYLHDRVANTTIELPLPRQTQGSAYNYALIGSPRLSADGQWLAYSQENGLCLYGACQSIYLTSLSGKVVQHITGATRGPEPYRVWTYQSSLQAHEGWITALAFDPMESSLASGGQDGSVRIWRNAGKLESDRWPPSAALDNSAIVILERQWLVIDSWQADHALAFHQEAITDLAYSPRGELLASASKDHTVALWSPRMGSLHQVLRGHSSAVEGIAFSPDGTDLAAATREGIWLWEVEDSGNYQHTKTYPLNKNPVTSLAFATNGRYIAVAGAQNGDVWIQPLDQSRSPIVLKGHDKQVTDVTFSPDGKWLASASKDGSVNLWALSWAGDGARIEHRFTLWHTDWVDAIAFSPNSQHLATGTFASSLQIWDVSSGLPLQTIQSNRQDQIMEIQFSPLGSHLVFGGAQGALRIYSSVDRPAGPDKTSFFTRHDSDIIEETIPLQGWPYIYWQNQFPSYYQYYSSPEEAQSQVSFTLSKPATPLQDLTLNSVLIAPNPKLQEPVVIYNYIHTSSFQPSYLLFYQSQINPRDALNHLGASAHIVELEINANPAEFTQGDWVYEDGSQLAPGFSNKIRYHWDNQVASYRLRWQENGIYFSLEYHQAYDQAILRQEDRLQIYDLLAFINQLAPLEMPDR